MTSLPYPTFINQNPANINNGKANLQAVGKCRIYPEQMDKTEYRSIVAKNIEQANVDVTTTTVENQKANKKLRKKLMKEGVAMAKKFLMGTLNIDVSIVEVEMYVNADDLIASDGCLAACLLDAGCQSIVCDGTNIDALDIAKVPRDRLIAHFTIPETVEDVINDVVALSSKISIEVSDDVVPPTADHLCEILSLELAKQKAKRNGFQVVIQVNPTNFNANDTELASIIGPVLKTCKDGHGGLTMVDPSPSQLGLCYAACIRTDRPDGLFTTVVCNRSEEALGLVYSSKESIVAALECGRGVYYSRSRKGLWRKGDTSGHYQTLHRLDVDCDGDALRFCVTQHGDDVAAFCHLNTLSCWGEPRGIRQLEGILKERLAKAPEGSYTKRLFDDPELLRDKLVEEAQELSEATTKAHVAEELADVLYFAMTKAIKAGVGIDDAVAELDRRSRKVTRRKGDSKACRISAANQILEK
mmetsp:Transcript_27738/g.31705  ORF Transcript_27738/g.31705 Transcript_27738/m.31705 type:complete len:472 (-) Transcript_27738:57-1472(-)